jgi:predicted ATPase/class 3 adenylate cyclase
MSEALGRPQSAPTMLSMLFTDIEGSTRLLHEIGDEYAKVLSRHFGILTAAVGRHAGRVVHKSGDALFAVFEDPMRCVNSAIEAQKALFEETWPERGDVRVRMGLHAGEVQIYEHDYVGIDVHRAARISAAAHGGQVVLSRAVRFGLSEDGLPEGVSLRSLGLHRLKDLHYPEELFDLAIPGLPAEFGLLRSLGLRNTNLPSDPARLVGRSNERAQLRKLLISDHCRLVTLTGPGGTGKTSLALATARELQDHFPGGVFWTPLDDVVDPTLVAAAVSQSLGFQEHPGMTAVDVIRKHIAESATLLIFDTFERVLGAAAMLAELLWGCPQLSILVTSRERLNLRGEVEFEVPPLCLPDAGLGLEVISANESVQLFVECAREKRPRFSLTAENAGPIARICRRLDGLPLAIELAASRIALLEPAVLEVRLERSLGILKGRRRGSGRRHQTLHDTIQWSDNLLTLDERRIFHWVSVFAGGFDVETAEEIFGMFEDLDLDVIDGLDSLVGKSLLTRSTTLGRPRLMMLDTIRQYAAAGLSASADHAALRERHAVYFEKVAGEAGTNVLNDDQRNHVERLYKEAGNIRGALQWALEQPDAEATGRFLEMLKWFWISRGLLTEATSWVNQAIKQVEPLGDTRAKAAVLNVAGWITYVSGRYAAALEPAVEARRIFALLRDRAGMASAGIIAGIAKAVAGEVPEGPQLIIESLELFRELGEDHGAAIALIALGEGARAEGDLVAAEELHAEALELLRRARNSFWPGLLLQNFAHYRLREGDWQSASKYASEAMALGEEFDYPIVLNLSVMAKGGVALAKGDAARAARLLSATQARQDKLGAKFEPTDQADFERYRKLAQEALSEVDLRVAYLSGATADWSEILEEARQI